MNTDLTGQIFGKLTVVERLPRYKRGRTYYRCICSCGNERIVDVSDLTSGKVIQCSECYKQDIREQKRIDRTGERFGQLTIIEMLYNYNGGKRTYARCLCDCGNERIVKIDELVTGKVIACNECTEQLRIEKVRKDYTGQRFGRLVVKEMLYNYGPNNRTHALCICDCGNEKIVDMRNLIGGSVRSCGCWERESRFERSHYIDITGNKYGKLTVIGLSGNKYSNGAVLWDCECECGNHVQASYTSLTKGQTLSCGCRKNSKWEDFIDNYLRSQNIDFVREKRFPDCKNIQGNNTLPFDFYIESLNLIIEYDGEHHFRPIAYWGGQEKFEITKRNDNIKNEYCKNSNIKLLRLPYTLKENEIIEKINSVLYP